jgi:hypothetical protein
LKVEVIKLDEMKTDQADIIFELFSSGRFPSFRKIFFPSLSVQAIFDRFSETSSGVNNIIQVDKISLPTMPVKRNTTMYLTKDKLPSARSDKSNNALLAHNKNSGTELPASLLQLPLLPKVTARRCSVQVAVTKFTMRKHGESMSSECSLKFKGLK